MSIFNVISMLGGLALFLFGMDLMSNSLQNVSGKQLKSLMESLTTSKIRGALLGMAVTALIQSSSGTTVIVVGLVNSAIMTLTQAINVIMGANIGTTITAWILSLSSLSGDSLIVKLLQPSTFSPILAMIGVIMTMVNKENKKAEIGKVMIGFAILMFGMGTMSDSMAPLAEVPEFADIMVKFTNPILGILMGAVVTAIIQSSSASIGILQSLSSTGLLPFGAVLPIIMGQNIGTCATALISTIGAKRNARRAAILHLLFNILGAVLFISAVYVGHSIFDFAFMYLTAKPVYIALSHTLMNVFATIILLPLSQYLVKLAYVIFPITEEDYDETDAEFEKLDQRFVQSPSIALEHCYTLSVDMFMFSIGAVRKAIDLVYNYDEEKFKEIKEIEDKVDRYEDKLGEYLVEISHHTLSKDEMKVQSLVLQIIGDFERIADHGRNMSQSAKELYEKDLDFSEAAQEELRVYFEAILDLLDETYQAYNTLSLSAAYDIEPFEEYIDQVTDEILTRHVERVRLGSCSIEMGFILSDVVTNLERVADHCSNIGVAIILSNKEDSQLHDYKAGILKDSEEFLSVYRRKQEKYRLPEVEI